MSNKFDTYLIDSVQAFKDLQEYVASNNYEYVFLDTETNSSHPKKAEIWGIGLCFNDKEAFYIPIKDKEGRRVLEYIEPQIKEWVVKVCTTHKLVGHNIVYDVTVLLPFLNFDLTPYIYSDTILLKHTVEEEPPHGLKETAVKYLGMWADKAQDKLYANIKANGGRTTKDEMQMYLADTEVLAEYCMWDCILTAKLFYKLSNILKQENLEDLFYKEEIMPLYREVTIPMNQKGFPIDVEHFNTLDKEIALDIKKLEDKVIEQIEDKISSYCVQILDEEFPVKTSGNFPKALALVSGIKLPEHNGKISLAKKYVKYAMEQNPQHSEFYTWLLEGGDLPPYFPKIEAQMKMFFDKYPDRNHVFNLRSNDDLKYLAFDILKETPTHYTETGSPQINDDFLETIKNK
jgi:hypothetical protein